MEGDIVLYAQWEKVVVPKVALQKISNKKRARVELRLRKGDAGIMGYEFQYSEKKSFPKNKTKIIKTPKTKIVIKKGLRKRTYYVKVRAYELDSAQNKVFGKWSMTKKFKITK